MSTQKAPEPLKPPRTFEEQLDILIGRGLTVTNRQKAIQTLERLNYYRFTAYALTFKNGDIFDQGITFETLYRHYEFDMRLRILLLEIIEPIEIAFRTHIAYLIAHKYGNEGHLDPKNFKNTYRHSEFTRDLNDCLGKSSKDLFVNHHMQKYGGRFPVWVALEVITLSTLSKLYANLITNDKKQIAQSYYPNAHHTEISNWLLIISIIRNRCAHYSRLFNRVLSFSVKIPRAYAPFKISTTGLFAAIVGIKQLSVDEKWQAWVPKLKALISTYPDIEVKRIGFIRDWEIALNK